MRHSFVNTSDCRPASEKGHFDNANMRPLGPFLDKQAVLSFRPVETKPGRRAGALLSRAVAEQSAPTDELSRL